jgi:hypothetical protein
MRRKKSRRALCIVSFLKADLGTGGLQQMLHTLRDDERPVDLQAKAIKRFVEASLEDTHFLRFGREF